MELVIIWLICAFGAAAIASNKEGNVAVAFVVGLLFGPLGVLLALIGSGPSGRCPHCRKKINAKATICPHCQSSLTPRKVEIATAETLGVLAGTGVMLRTVDLIGDDGHAYEAPRDLVVQILGRRPGKVHITGGNASGWIKEKHLRVDAEPRAVPPSGVVNAQPQMPTARPKIDVALLKPRILPGGYRVEVVGESYYAAALDGIADDGQTQVWADLVVEDDNPYDPNAVRVEIDGQKVGHLSREIAPTYRPVGLRLRQLGFVGRCAATINGSERRKLFGVVLDLAAPEKILEELKTASPAAAAPSKEPVRWGALPGSQD